MSDQKKGTGYFPVCCEIFACIGAVLGFVYISLNSEFFHVILPGLDKIGVCLFTVSLLLSAIIAFFSWTRKAGDLEKLPFVSGTMSRRMVLILLTLAVCVALIPVLSTWSTASSRVNGVGGLVPISDAGFYYNGAEKVLQSGKLDSVNQRRPIHALFLASKLVLTNFNFRLTVLLQAGLLGLSAFLAAFAVMRTHGKVAGLVVFSAILGMTSLFLPEVLTEPFGVMWGCLAFALLWFGIFENHQPAFLSGIFFITLALLVRAGPMLVLPFLLLYAGYLFRKEGKFNVRIVLVATGLVALGFAINQALIWAFGDGTGMMMSNYAYVLYGLAAGGKGWMYYQTGLPPMTGTESEISAILYHESFRLIAQNPAGFAMTIIHELIVEPVTALQQMFQALFTGHYLWPLPDGISQVFCYIFYAALLLGLFHFMGLEKGHFITVFLFGTLGAILLSLPFFYQDAGFRALAAVFPVIAAVIAMGTIGWRKSYELFPEKTPDPENFIRVSVLLGLVIILMICIIPFVGPALSGMMYWNTPHSTFNQTTVPPGQLVVMRVDPGIPFIQLIDDGSGIHTFCPLVNKKDLLIPQWMITNYNLSQYPQNPSRPVFLRGYNYQTQGTILLLAPEGFIPEKREIRSFNVTTLDMKFEVTSIYIVS